MASAVVVLEDGHVGCRAEDEEEEEDGGDGDVDVFLGDAA